MSEDLEEIVERRATRLLKNALLDSSSRNDFLFQKAIEQAKSELDIDDPPSVGSDGRVTYRDWDHFGKS